MSKNPIETVTEPVETVTIDTTAADKKAKAKAKEAAADAKAIKALKAQMEKLIAENKKLSEDNKELKDGITRTDKDALEKAAAELLRNASEINEAFEALSSTEERREFIAALEEDLGLKGFITKHFTIPEDAADPVLPANDLPMSEIISNLPVRVIEQRLYNTLQNYELAKFIKVENVRNGMKQIFYGDYKDTDAKKAYDDVTISDFNGETTPAGTELFKVDTDVHTSYKILDTALNDVTISMGLFLAIVSSSLNGFTKPLAKKMYSRFITFLDTAASYDENLSFVAGSDAKAKAKAVAAKLFSLKTTSRKHLKKVPNGLNGALEYKINLANTVLILNKDYAADYKFDLSAMTFQLGEITYPVKEIIIVDFELAAEYTEGNTDFLKEREVLLMEDGVYNEIRHYSGTKQVVTPKLFSIFHFYTRIANFRRKDKILLSWDTASKK